MPKQQKGEGTILIQCTDFNAADTIISANFSTEWNDIHSALAAMPLYIKGSAQAGIQGNPIFDPVGTNEYVKTELLKLGWQHKIPVPTQYKFLGADVDFGKSGILLGVQFSHYSFLLNNTLRSELFFNSKIPLTGHPTQLVIMVTKSKMFPASNSSLFYEQAVKQLTALAQNNVFDVPIRIVGLFEPNNTTIPVTWTAYKAKTSKTIIEQQTLQCQITPGRSKRSRSVLTIV